MNYRKLDRTGLKVSKTSFGAVGIGRKWGIPVPNDFGRADEIIRAIQSMEST